MKLFIFVVFVMAAEALDSCYTNTERKNIEELQNHILAFTKSVDTLKTDLKGKYTVLNGGCHKDWKPFRDHCYYLVKEKKTWFEGERFCKKEGSSLVNVKDKDENKWLQSQFKDVKAFWLGITDGDLKHWINAVDYAPTTYFNWESGQPGNGAENCGMFHPDNGKWHDYPCSTYLHPFVCKKDVSWKFQEKYCQNKGQNTSADDILCMKPFQYLPNFKNPCWRDVNYAIKCLPYFMLIGIDKSGTTDLFSRITKHPEIKGNTGNQEKETKWWSWLRYGFWLRQNAKRRRQTFYEYISYFDSSAAHKGNTVNDKRYHNVITGDGTPMDMWYYRGWPQIPQNLHKSDPEVLTPHLIRHINPDMKFIIILRNPIDRLYSDYFFLKRGVPTSAAFDVAVNSSIQILNECTRARINVGFYSVYLSEWFKVFPRDQFFILRTEDYTKDMFNHMSKLFKFLKAGELNIKQMSDLGILSKNRKHVTKVKQKVAPMSHVTRKKLLKLYTPFNKELSAMLNDSRFLWKDI
ncbi:carbohydrate sulfotransferase 15-like [Mytilus trossulus]|uniref:carbohydrate sulfotransferase 15-like n=1 Tax=Mytilus trossulus TaxID=6551 RepID=UPI00300448B1